MSAAIENDLQVWRGTLPGELADLELQQARVRDLIAEKRAKVAAIDRLLDKSSTENVNVLEDGNSEATSGNHVGPSRLLPRSRKFAPVQAYWRPILEVLVGFGGTGQRLDVVKAVGKKMKDTLTPADYEQLPNTYAIRWENRVVWQASNMRQRGLISKDSARGIWEITPDGRKWLDDNP